MRATAANRLAHPLAVTETPGRAMLGSMMEIRQRHALPVLGIVVAVGGACSGGGANRPIDRGALEAMDHDTQRVTSHDEPATAFESKPAAARTLPSLEDPLRLRLVQGYQRAGA